MAGKGGKGLLAAKTTAAKSTDKDKDKDKKKAPVSRSSRAGLQVLFPSPNPPPAASFLLRLVVLGSDLWFLPSNFTCTAANLARVY